MDRTLGVEKMPPWSERDYWPLTRLLILLGCGAAFGHYAYGWSFGLRSAGPAAATVFETATLLALVSAFLAHWYLALFVFPLAGLVYLNDWLYRGPVFVLRKLLPGKAEAALKPLGLLCELALFYGLFCAGRWTWLHL
jgi:hypothetical protein